MHDLVLTGGRVIDPETGFDGTADLAVDDGRVSAIGTVTAPARTAVDVSGLVVAPGFVDLHSHAQNPASGLLQACDGVTTALELELGAVDVERSYRRATQDGRPTNYGFSASWFGARRSVLGGLDPRRADLDPLVHIGTGASTWTREGTSRLRERILAHLEEQVAAGALGIGVVPGYAPMSAHVEYVEVARLAARLGVPTFTHARYKNQREPGTALQGVQEVVAAGVDSGAHMHLCHLNSTSLRQIDLVTSLIESARAAGIAVTTEVYPYGTSSTAIGAPFLHPDNLPRLGVAPHDIVHLPTGERPRDAARLARLREQDPAGLALVHYLDETRPDDRDILTRAVLFADTMIASDALPMYHPGGAAVSDGWPPPGDVVTHPRGAGTFARTLRVYVRERRLLGLAEVVRRATLLPARVLEPSCPAARRKGRLVVGADADITVFDPDTVSDRATFAAPARPSSGFRHVLVHGTFVVRDGIPDPPARPGRPLRR